MCTYEESKYVMSEIRFIKFYEKKVKKLGEQIDEIQEKIDHSTDPHSPNGGVDVGGVRYKIPSNHSNNSENVINSLITAENALEAKKKIFEIRLTGAEGYKKKLLETRHKNFVTDFFDRRLNYHAIESKYYCSNAYMKMCHLIMDTIKTI